MAPLLAQTKEFQSGQVELDWEALTEEVFGAAGYKDGGARFFKKNPAPAANPMADLQTQKLKSEIAKNERTGKAAMFTGISSLAKVALGQRELEAEVVDRLLGRQHDATMAGTDHGHRSNEQHLSALDHGHRHGLAIAAHRHTVNEAARAAAQEAMQPSGEGGGGGEAPAPGGAPAPTAATQGPAPQGGDQSALLMELLRSGKLEFTRGKDGRISGVRMPQGGGPGGSPYPMPPGEGPAPQGPAPQGPAPQGPAPGPAPQGPPPGPPMQTAPPAPPPAPPSPMAATPPPQGNEMLMARLAAIEGHLSRLSGAPNG